MGRTPTIDEQTGERLIAAYGRLGSKRGAAEEVGVSIGAAQRFFESLPKAAAPTIVTQERVIETAGASLFNSTAALEENYRKVQRLIDMLEAGIIEVRNGAKGERYETMVSPVVLVAALKEARGYIDSSTNLLELMISVNEVRRFQQAMLDVLSQHVDETTRQRIFADLRQRLPFGLLPGGGG